VFVDTNNSAAISGALRFVGQVADHAKLGLTELLDVAAGRFDGGRGTIQHIENGSPQRGMRGPMMGRRARMVLH
jgi:hypothetical protein